MYLIQRSCQRALQGRIALSNPTTARRAFSQTPIARRGTLPGFLPPSSPELSQLLYTLNSKVLLLRHLNKDQQDLIYKRENRQKLEAEPPEITLGEVTLPLQFIDRNRDVPNAKKHLYDIIKFSRTKDDYENVVRVIEGYENAGIHLKSHWQEKIVESMRYAEMQHLILKAVQRSKDTGIRLSNWPVLSRVLAAMREKAAQAGWAKKETEAALKMVTQVVELMEEKEHFGNSEGAADYRTHPTVIAAPLELAAELAYRHEGDTERVKKQAGRLMKGLEQRGFINTEGENDITALRTAAKTRPSDFPNTKRQCNYFFTVVRKISDLIPIWNGLSTARTMLDDDMPMPAEAEKVQKAIYAAIEEGLEALEALAVRNGEKVITVQGSLNHTKKAVEACLDDGEEEA